MRQCIDKSFAFSAELEDQAFEIARGHLKRNAGDHCFEECDTIGKRECIGLVNQLL